MTQRFALRYMSDVAEQFRFYHEKEWDEKEAKKHSDCIQIMDLAIIALKRSVPKEAKNVRKNGSHVIGNCSTCDQFVVGREFSFCPYCGQRIDWRD